MPAPRCGNPVTFHRLLYRVYAPWQRRFPVAVLGRGLPGIAARALMMMMMMVPRSYPRRL